jgi:Holliday junction resolvasome RuvABC ATP-dependent DNA helicase subunit
MMEKLSTPFKNRFVYKFHLTEYNSSEKALIISRYLNHYNIKFENNILDNISDRFESVPREIHNMCIKIRDYITSHTKDHKLHLDIYIRNDFVNRIGVDSDGLGAMHHRYLEILKTYDKPV